MDLRLVLAIYLVIPAETRETQIGPSSVWRAGSRDAVAKIDRER